MNFLNGLLATIGSLVLVAAGIMMVLIASEAISPNVIPGGAFDSELADVASATGSGLWTYVGAAIVLIAVGTLVLVVEFLHAVRAASPGMVLLRSEEAGVVRISLESVRQLAERICQGNRSVRRTRCAVRMTDGGLQMQCAVGLNMGAEVPGESSAIQRDVKEVVERLTGLPVVEVSIRAHYVKDREQAVLAR